MVVYGELAACAKQRSYHQRSFHAAQAERSEIILNKINWLHVFMDTTLVVSVLNYLAITRWCTEKMEPTLAPVVKNRVSKNLKSIWVYT
jgi:hypothetical protein